MSFDMSASIDVSPGVVRDMVAAGVLQASETEFGEMSVKLSLEAVSWASAFTFERGSTHPLLGISALSPQHQAKLSIMLLLSSQGWRDRLPDLHLEYHSRESPLFFEPVASRPKSCFVALAISDRIFEKFEACDTTELSLPVIYHGLSDSYYKALLSLKTKQDVLALNALLSGASNMKQLTDKAFAALTRSGEGDEADEEGDDLSARDAAILEPLMPLPAPALQGARSMHAAALAVLRGVPRGSVDLTDSRGATFGGVTYRAHFDHFSHQSGRQRCYIACPNKQHVACFKYGFVHLFRDKEHIAAWQIAWARHAVGKPNSFTKKHHLAYVPSEEEVAAASSGFL